MSVPRSSSDPEPPPGHVQDDGDAPEPGGDLGGVPLDPAQSPAPSSPVNQSASSPVAEASAHALEPEPESEADITAAPDLSPDGMDEQGYVSIPLDQQLENVSLDSPQLEHVTLDDAPNGAGSGDVVDTVSLRSSPAPSPPASPHRFLPTSNPGSPSSVPPHTSFTSPRASSSTDDTPPTPPPHSPTPLRPLRTQAFRAPSPPLPPIPAAALAVERSPPPTPPKDRPSPVPSLLTPGGMPHSPSPVESLSSRRGQGVEPITITKASPPDTPHTPTHEQSESQSSLSALSPQPGHTAPRTPEFITSPRFRSMDLQPAEENSEDEEDGDPSGLYENVSLDVEPETEEDETASVRSPPTVNAKLKDVVDGKPTLPAAISIAATNGSSRGSLESPASGSSTPRRHAPPAHPHPFPIPTSPRAAHGPVPQVGDIPGHKDGGPQRGALGVKGVNTMDKFMSRTRPQHLPPKPKAEDEEHLHEWELMMAQARQHDAERRKQEDLRRAEREKHLLTVTPRWEAMLEHDFSVQKIKSNPSHRQLWFEGVPPHLRGKAWSLAIGNPLAMHKDAYKGYLRRAHRALSNGRFPADILAQIDADLDETLPILHVFQRGSPVRDELRELVAAWVVYRSDSGRGYAPYITLLAAMFSLVSPPAQAFLSLCNFLSRPCMNAFYTDTRDEIDAFYRVFENLQADMFPRIYANCKNLGLQLPESYFRSVLVEQVPFEAVCRLWDQIMLEGDGYIFRAALAIFGFLEPRLYYPDHDEIASVLEGRNAATAAIAERERERARLRGEQYEENLDGKLSVFGLHENALFDWLAQDGWKDSRFERLVVRELPD